MSPMWVIVFAVAIVALPCVPLMFLAISENAADRRMKEDMEEYRERLDRIIERVPANPHAWKLGQVCEAKVYEGSEWEPMLVVAVSHKGAVAVRPVNDPDCPARWIDKEKVARRVRWTR